MPDDAGGITPKQRAMAAMAVLRTPSPQRDRIAKIAAALAGLVVLAMFGHWLLIGRHMVSTNNAYVRAEISDVAAQVQGYVTAIPVAENARVEAGDVLMEIDPADYRIAVQAAEANLARAQAQAAAARSGQRAAAGRSGGQGDQVRIAAANLAAAEAEARRAQSELNRQQRLAAEGFIAPTRLESLQSQAQAARADAAAARAALQWERAQSGVLGATRQQASGDAAAAQAAIQAARAELDAANLNLARTRITAPIAGTLTHRMVQIGQLVRPGAQLLSIVPDTVYVEANFKETQIARMRAGQRVVLRPDIDHGVRIHGEIESIAPAAGSEFSFIPIENASGNFTKVVQRVPVRIRIDADETARRYLRPGLSVTATVDTRAQ